MLPNIAMYKETTRENSIKVEENKESNLKAHVKHEKKSVVVEMEDRKKRTQ